jgi:hypothetical protein
MPALNPLFTLYLMMANITGPTDTDRNIPSPKPATIAAIMVKISKRQMLNPKLQEQLPVNGTGSLEFGI